MTKSELTPHQKLVELTEHVVNNHVEEEIVGKRDRVSVYAPDEMDPSEGLVGGIAFSTESLMYTILSTGVEKETGESLTDEEVAQLLEKFLPFYVIWLAQNDIQPELDPTGIAATTSSL